MKRADAGLVIGRGIAFPPRVGSDGRVAWSEGETNVREGLQITLLTEQKERLLEPTFGAGLGRFLFEPNTVATRHQIAERITRALSAWEPRIAVESVVVDAGESGEAVATVTYQLVATQAGGRLQFSVRLSG